MALNDVEHCDVHHCHNDIVEKVHRELPNEDELYDLIVNKSKALQVNETYVEDFEKEDLYKRFYPISVSDGASFTYESSPNYSIDGTSLCLRSQGDYAGLTFGGMKFAKNSTYRIKFDYKIITASNDFFFQFRSITGGTPTDIYQTISGNSGFNSFSVDLSGISGTTNVTYGGDTVSIQNAITSIENRLNALEGLWEINPSDSTQLIAKNSRSAKAAGFYDSTVN